MLLHGATRQHLRRIKVLLEKGSVGCRVKRCSLHLLCDDCPWLHATPPESATSTSAAEAWQAWSHAAAPVARLGETGGVVMGTIVGHDG